MSPSSTASSALTSSESSEAKSGKLRNGLPSRETNVVAAPVTGERSPAVPLQLEAPIGIRGTRR
jgi:hypothetical protein